MSPFQWYTACLDRLGYKADEAQQRALEHLERLHADLLALTSKNSFAFFNWFSRKKPLRGLYFWGGVGRGKSFLMDHFYQYAPIPEKRRLHFHRFMQEVHEQLADLRGRPDPLEEVARRIAENLRLLCLDEFHVTDIADAMILARLLEELLGHGVALVMTSNRPPDDLYQNGLQRARFLPAIELIKAQLDVVNVDGGRDYRLRVLEKASVYQQPCGAEADEALAEIYASMARDGDAGDPILVVNHREIRVRRRASGVVWFDFTDLCGGPRSQSDYLEIAREYPAVVLSGVPRMNAEKASEARRFTWLVDVFYDHRVKLILSADAPPDDLYTQGTNSFEFARTASRLHEMQSHAYLAEEHIV